MNIQQLNNELGNIDIYLLDQILKGRISPDTKILDAGCGEGRNLIYFLNNGYSIKGMDQNPDAIRMLHFILGSKYPNYTKEDFQVGSLEKLPYATASFQYIICSAVLHFAKDPDHFWSMFNNLDAVLAPKGTLFIRSASDMGLEGHEPLGNGRYTLPDGSTRFLIDLSMIEKIKNEYGFIEIEPIKTVLVNNQRSMTTLVLQKN